MKNRNRYTDFRFFDKLIEKINSYVTKMHKNILITIVLFEARSYANKNLPRDDDESLGPYLDTIRGAYQNLKKEVSVSLQGGVQKTLGAVNVSTSNQKIDKKSKEIEILNVKENHLLTDRGRIHVGHDQLLYGKARFIVGVLSLGDVIWNITAFLKIGDILLLAVAAAIIIGIAQVSAVKTFTLITKEIEDRIKRNRNIIYMTSASSGFSLLLGLLRYWFMHGANIPFIFINPFTFAAINLLFMIATAFVVYYYYPTREELKKINNLKKIDIELEKVKKEQTFLKTELRELLEEREFLAELRLKIQHAEETLHGRTDNLYEEAVGAFKLENTVKRSDGLFPKVFKIQHDPLGRFDADNLLFT